MKNKNLLIIIGVVVLFVSIGFFSFSNLKKEDGSTIESRENILKEQDSFMHITSEIELDNYLIGAITSNNKIGISIFESENNGKYRFLMQLLTTEDVVFHTFKEYDLFWCNKEDLDYAMVTYTVEGIVQEPIKIDVKDYKVSYLKSPQAKSYSYKVEYYDKNGNVIK